MTLSLQNATKVINPRGRHTVIHGIGGSGKTTFAANAAKIENGLLIQLGEDGLSQIGITDVNHIDIGTKNEPGNLDQAVQSWLDYQNVLKDLITTKHDFKTVIQEPLSTIIGSIFEGFIVKTFYGGDYNKANDFGKKFQQYQTEFNKILEAINVLLNKGINVITLLHSQPTDYKDPSTEPYKKWDFVLPQGNKVNLSTQLFNHADAVFFGCYDTVVADGKATGGKRRILKTTQEAAYTAKPMRLPQGNTLPEQILFDYTTYKSLVTKG